MSVFLDETGVLLGLRRTHARSERGKASLWGKTFLSRGKSHSNWSITLQEVVALMTIDNSMDSQAFEVFTLEMFGATIVVGSRSSYG